MEAGEVPSADGDAASGRRRQYPGQHVPEFLGCLRDEPKPNDTIEFGPGFTECNAICGGDDVSNVGMLVGRVYELLGTYRIGGAQQGAEFYRDRPAKTDHFVSLVLDVPRKVHRRSELGRCNTDQGLGLIVSGDEYQDPRRGED